MKKAFWLILTGIAIGILVAPDKGSETLKKIKDKLDDLKDRAADNINDMVDTVRESTQKTGENVKSISTEW
jgi:gas vesicle protein